jgi:nucleolar protein 4
LARELSKVQKKIKIVPEGPGKAPKTAIQRKLENSVTILVSDLPQDLPKSVFYKKARKFGTVEKLITTETDAEVLLGTAKVVYSAPEEAQKAVKGLNDHTYKGVKIKCRFIETITAASLAKKSRLIIRNLAFHCKKEQLINVFEVFGTITECSVPTKDGKARGFGFVQFENVEDATKAIEGVNGQNILNRPVAVDWALGKTQYDKMAADQESESESESEEDGQTAVEDEGDDASIQDDDSPIIYNQEDSGDDEKYVEKEDAEGCTLFIRNLSFDTTKKKLKKTYAYA